MNVLGYRNLFATLEMRMKLKQKCARICFWDRYWGGADQILGTLRSNDADGNENVKKKGIGFISKTTILHVHHAFLYISLPVFARLRRKST